MVPTGRADISGERLVKVVDDALRPMEFSGSVARSMTPRPDWYWDYEFRSPSVGPFAQRNMVEILINYDDLSLILTDWDQATRATEFDRRVTEAIEAAVRSELGAEVAFQPVKSPAFCLGP